MAALAVQKEVLIRVILIDMIVHDGSRTHQGTQKSWVSGFGSEHNLSEVFLNLLFYYYNIFSIFDDFFKGSAPHYEISIM